jgi:8-oxo-dGTP pyrophosphatase MutT (NUDIX family)
VGGERDQGSPPQGLTRDVIRRRLAERGHVAPAAGRDAGGGGHGWQHGDHAAALLRPLDREPVPAAVLIGVVDRADGPTVLLTQRTAHLRDHAGQISFPGGRMEPEDADAAAAALREAEEEIGLPPGRVEVIGAIAPYDTVTGFRIHPVVGWVTPPFNLVPDPFEVADIFEVPLAFVLDPANHERHTHESGRLRRHYYVLPYRGRRIWGATAGMLVNLSLVLR